MKIILIAIIPLLILSDIKYPWEWNWKSHLDTINNFANKFDDIIEKFVTSTPIFINQISEKLVQFTNYTEEKKNEIIEISKNELEELHQKLKKQKNKYLKPFLEKATETANYISLKICNMTQFDSYEECRNYKKNLFSKIIILLKEELSCSQIIKAITSDILSDDYEQNLKYILFLINAISNNSDSLKKGKSILIYDTMSCLQEKFDEYFPKVIKKLKDKSPKYTFSFKFDIMKLLINSFSNLIEIIHFEEIDGFIQKANEKTGLIPNKNSIKIYHNIFKALQKLNEFGNNFYNISSLLSLNVTINPGNLEASADAELSITDLKNKGIKIHLFTNYMLRSTGAHSIQTVVFDSPFVSIRRDRNKNGGTSNTFVGITLYDKEGKEIFVKDLNINKFKPIIYYEKKLFNSMTTCLFFNEKNNFMEDSGIISETEIIDGEEYIKCIPKHLSSFSIGSYNKGKILDKSPNLFHKLLKILKIIIIIIIAFIFLFICFCIYMSSKN